MSEEYIKINISSFSDTDKKELYEILDIILTKFKEVDNNHINTEKLEKIKKELYENLDFYFDDKHRLEQEFKFIKENLDKITCIGEVGMDFYWDKDHHEEQKEIFRKIIQFVILIKKPILIHSRKAEEECLDLLEEEIKNSQIPVIMHCFQGRKSLMTRAIRLGYYFSIPYLSGGILV